MPKCPLSQSDEIARVVFHTDFSGEALEVIHHVIAANCDDCRKRIHDVVDLRLKQINEDEVSKKCPEYQDKVFDHCKKIMELSGLTLDKK